jgi:hypothetical protein
MPCDLYELRLIDRLTRKPFPAEPLWTGFQLSRAPMVSFPLPAALATAIAKDLAHRYGADIASAD